MPYLAIVLVIHPLLRKLYDSFWRSSSYTAIKTHNGRQEGLTMGLSASAAADTRMEQRISFDYYFALIFNAALHGFSSIKILTILYANFYLAKNIPKHLLPAATWIFNIGILFANELSRGYPYARIVGSFVPNEKANWGVWLDNHGGLIPRWEVLFNFTVMRLISFNMDYCWSLNMRGGSPIEVCTSPSQAANQQTNGAQEETTRPLQPQRTRPCQHARQAA